MGAGCSAACGFPNAGQYYAGHYLSRKEDAAAVAARSAEQTAEQAKTRPPPVPGCPNASNPWHECGESCKKAMAEVVTGVPVA